MDSQSRAFEAVVEVAGTPLRCPRPMTAEPLQPWTAGQIAAALFSALISTPLIPAVSRRRA